MQAFRESEAALWQDDWLAEKYQQVNARFEDRVLHATTVRDEIRRGVRQSDEAIEVTLYAWINRFITKIARFARMTDVTIAGVRGDVVFDLLEHVAEFEPQMKPEQFWQLLALQQPSLSKNRTAKHISAVENEAQLIKCGVKTLTATPQVIFEAQSERQPQVGDIKVVLYPNGNVCCAVKTSNVEVAPFNQVSRMQAYREADGDKSLAYWQMTRQLFFKRALQEYNLAFNDTLPIVLESYVAIATPYNLVYNKIDTKPR